MADPDHRGACGVGGRLVPQLKKKKYIYMGVLFFVWSNFLTIFIDHRLQITIQDFSVRYAL